MLEAFYATERGSLEDATINGGFDLYPELVWIDLIAPSQEEQQWVLDAYERNLPTLKSLEDISSSARFYRDDDGILHISTYFLTKNKNFQSDREQEDLENTLAATVHTVAFLLEKIDSLLCVVKNSLLSAPFVHALGGMIMRWTIKIPFGFY